MGLTRFADFVRGDSDGITYIDTIFLKPTQSENENVYFHELIHIIQWRLLGPDRREWLGMLWLSAESVGSYGV